MLRATNSRSVLLVLPEVLALSPRPSGKRQHPQGSRQCALYVEVLVGHRLPRTTARRRSDRGGPRAVDSSVRAAGWPGTDVAVGRRLRESSRAASCSLRPARETGAPALSRPGADLYGSPTKISERTSTGSRTNARVSRSMKWPPRGRGFPTLDWRFTRGRAPPIASNKAAIHPRKWAAPEVERDREPYLGQSTSCSPKAGSDHGYGFGRRIRGQGRGRRRDPRSKLASTWLFYSAERRRDAFVGGQEFERVACKQGR